MVQDDGKESTLKVKWPWVLSGIFVVFGWLFSLSYTQTIAQERRITTLEESNKAVVATMCRIESKTDKIQSEQSEFLKEFYKRIR